MVMGGLTTDLGEVVKLVLYSPGCLVMSLVVSLVMSLVVSLVMSLVVSSPRLQSSESQRQAVVVVASSETGRGLHWASTTRGFSTLPSRVSRGRHSLITESEPSACCQE